MWKPAVWPCFHHVCSVGAHSPLCVSLGKPKSPNTLSNQHRSNANVPHRENTPIIAGSVRTQRGYKSNGQISAFINPKNHTTNKCQTQSMLIELLFVNWNAAESDKQPNTWLILSASTTPVFRALGNYAWMYLHHSTVARNVPGLELFLIRQHKE